LNCCYLPFSVHPDSLKQAVESIRALSMLGANLTIPHKEAVIPMLDSIDEEAIAIGAVNTIVNTDRRLRGYNTDGKGFMRSLEEHGVTAAGKHILIIGTGGASRAIGHYLIREASSLSLFDMMRNKADALASHLAAGGGDIRILDELKSAEGFDIVINATPLGLKESDPSPVDTDTLASAQVVCDLIYHKTLLLKQAEAKGCKTVGGAGMLLWQGALAFELWTGAAPPLEIMRSALLSNPA